MPFASILEQMSLRLLHHLSIKPCVLMTMLVAWFLRHLMNYGWYFGCQRLITEQHWGIVPR